MEGAVGVAGGRREAVKTHVEHPQDFNWPPAFDDQCNVIASCGVRGDVCSSDASCCAGLLCDIDQCQPPPQMPRLQR